MKCLNPVTIPNKKLIKSLDVYYNLNNSVDRKLYEMRYGKEAYIDVPCGKCPACIERKSNDWAARVYYEWLYSKISQFCTLTYSDEFLPMSDVTIQLGSYIEQHYLPTLSKEHVQKFMKRFRKMCGNGIRFFLGGEYGEDGGRPHYHLMLVDYPIKYNDELVDIIKSAWSYGNVETGDTNIQRCIYVAKYIYSSSTFDFRYITGLQKPFTLQSRRPGLGYKYYQDKKIIDYYNSTLDKSISIDDGKKLGMPRYYRDKIFTQENKELLYKNWLEDTTPPPTRDEIEIFLKRFNKKKRGKSI